MTDIEKTRQGSEEDQCEPASKPKLVTQLKQLYDERPAIFAVGLIVVSILAFLLGGVISGDWAPKYVGHLDP